MHVGPIGGATVLGEEVTPVAAVEVNVAVVAGAPAEVVGGLEVVTLVVVGRGVEVVLTVLVVTDVDDADPVSGTDVLLVPEGC